MSARQAPCGRWKRIYKKTHTITKSLRLYYLARGLGVVSILSTTIADPLRPEMNLIQPQWSGGVNSATLGSPPLFREREFMRESSSGAVFQHHHHHRQHDAHSTFLAPQVKTLMLVLHQEQGGRLFSAKGTRCVHVIIRLKKPGMGEWRGHFSQTCNNSLFFFHYYSS